MVPRDRVWTAKDDARYLSPWIGLPGRRHTVGMARHWHFLSVLFWVVNGLVFVVLLLSGNQWKRLVPVSWKIVPDAWDIFVYYATFHMPQEPNGFYHYNALQQLTYFTTIFVLAPLAILSGPSMSPALTNRFLWYPKLPGNRQIGRSLHFLVMLAFVIFITMHVAMIVITGVARNMNHIVLGTDNTRPLGWILGLVGIAAVVGGKRARLLAGLEASAHRSTCSQSRRHAADESAAGSSGTHGRIHSVRNLAVFLGQRQAAHLRRMEATGRTGVPKLPPQSSRPGGKPAESFPGRSPGHASEVANHPAPLHPGLVRHR